MPRQQIIIDEAPAYTHTGLWERIQRWANEQTLLVNNDWIADFRPTGEETVAKRKAKSNPDRKYLELCGIPKQYIDCPRCGAIGNDYHPESNILYYACNSYYKVDSAEQVWRCIECEEDC